MSVVKSFSVGEGDMFYISHNSDNFSVIDCCLYKKDGVKEPILKEIKQKQAGKGIRRFISTHPDDDHVSGIIDFESEAQINNFYVVQNKATKESENTDFEKYSELRDGKKAFYLQKGCTRKWMNKEDLVRRHSDLYCLWPITSNKKYIEALNNAAEGKSPNNISPVIQYKIHGFSFLWMGDMESDMQEEFDKQVANGHNTVVFAPHHGRKSGRIPQSLLEKLSPKIIIVGEAPSEDLEYYKGYNTVTQNTAGDIRFDISTGYIDIYVSSSTYTTDAGLINNPEALKYKELMYYLGSIKK